MKYNCKLRTLSARTIIRILVETVILKSQPITHVVEEYFQTSAQKTSSVNDILKHNVENTWRK
jgi:hypothetical protein